MADAPTHSWQRRWLRLAPLAVFCALLPFSGLVWRQQVSQQRRLLTRHTEDICFQTSRRLQVLVEALLRADAVFARRWSEHEERDFSRRRFEEFAAVLISEVPAYHTMRLVPEGGGEPWSVPRGAESAWGALGEARTALLRRASQEAGRPVLSPPVALRRGHTSVFAAVALRRGEERLGHLVAELETRRLVGSGFGQRTGAEFNLRVEDDGVALFELSSADGPLLDRAPMKASRRFAVLGRTWQVTLAPRPDLVNRAGWSANLAVPLLGLLLTAGLALLVHLVIRRMELYRKARDHAVAEVEQRKRAQRALAASEERYHSVFNSATDGLLVLDDDGRILEANPAACAMHEVADDELVGRSIRDFIAQGYRHLYDEFRRQIEQRGSARLDSVHLRPAGGAFDVEVRGARFSLRGRPCMLDIITDVSDRRRAVQRHALLSRKVLMAQEEERARVARELHDELGQVLTALHFELDLLHRKLSAADPAVAGTFVTAQQMLERAADELRAIVRGLRPPLLDDLGLAPAVRLLVEEMEERMEARVRLVLRREMEHRPVPSEVALCTYRVLQESLNNIRRHAEAERVTVELSLNEGEVALSVRDDGTGFDPDAPAAQGGCGIAGMRERAILVDANLTIDSAPGEGTEVSFVAPIPAPRPPGESPESDGQRGSDLARSDGDKEEP